MSAHVDSKHTISVSFLRTVQQANNFKLFLNRLLDDAKVKTDHTIVYIEHSNGKAGEYAFNTISRSLDAFNLNFITNAKNQDWLENYQIERSMGVFMMRLTQTIDILETVHEFRIDSLVKLNSQIEAYATIASQNTSLSAALIAKTNLGFTINRENLQVAMDDVDYKLKGFDFVDYSQLLEDVIRPISMRSLDENDLPRYNKALTEMLTKRQSQNAQGMIIRNTVFKHFTDTLQNKTSLHRNNIQSIAMQLTQGYFAVKSAAVMHSLRDMYQILSLKPMLSVDALLKPVRLHRESIGLVGFTQSAKSA